MTAANELVILHVNGVLLPLYIVLTLLAVWLVGLLKKPILRLENFCSLDPPLLPPPCMAEFIEKSGKDVGVMLSSTPITNWPAERLARAHAAAK